MVSYFRCKDYYDAVFPLVTDQPGLFHFVRKWRQKPPPAEVWHPGYYPDGEPVKDVAGKIRAAWQSEFLEDNEVDEWERLWERRNDVT